MFLMDIEGLIERGRQGDETALGNLYKAYHRQMTGICQRIVGNRQVAEELAHDAFLLAFAKLDQLHNAQRFEAWLTSITTNVARRYVQRHHEPTMLSLSTLTEEEFPMEPIPSDDKPLPTMAELMAAVDALPNGYGQVFKLAGMCTQALAAMDEPGATMETVEEKFPDFFKYAGHSITEVLDGLGMPKKAQRIITTYWPYLGANADVLDFAIYSRMLAGYVIYGAGMPRYRSHEISLALEKVIRDNGGEIWYNTEITEMLVKDGKACGVKIGDREYHAGSVVSSSYPDLVYGSMIDGEEVPERGVKLANSREIGLSFLTVYLGMNKSMEELGIDTYSNFIMPTTDSAQLQQAATGTHDYSGYVIMNCLNKLIPDCTPEGTCQLFFTTLYYGGWDDVTDPEEYRKLKNDTAMKMIRDCEKAMGISILPYIEEIVIAGPPTFARYLNTPEGTPYGYQVTKTDSFIQRQVEEKSEQFIKDLYFVGAASKRGDGYSSAYLSGIDAGKAILARAREKGGLVR